MGIRLPMSPAGATPRLTRIAIIAVIAVIALAWAVWATSEDKSNKSNSANTGKPSAPAPPNSAPGAAPPPAPPPPPVGKDYVEGLVQSVSGDAIQLRTRTGSATVDFAPATKVTERTPAQLTDVTAGSCVNVLPASGGAPDGGPVTAQSVTISPAVDGKCLPAPTAGSRGTPSAGVTGLVASVSGNTIAVNGLGAGGQTTPTNVTVTNTTSYSKDAVTDTQAIQNGKCMGAQGTNVDGVLRAAIISLQPCPPMGGGGHHHHLPHLPFHLPFHR